MSESKNTSAAAKNRAAGDGSDGGLTIPTLGGSTSASASTGNSAEGGPEALQASGQEAARPSMADIQRMADQQGRTQQAMHRPAVMRSDREQGADNPTMDLEMPISGSLDNMRRPDRHIEAVTDFGRWKDKAAELAFLEEIVCVRIHESNDPNAENPVQLGVNGRQVFIPRGEDVFVRRKYVEQLLRAKPVNIQTNIRRDGDGNVKNIITRTRALKYPFSIVRDDNPKGVAWERKIRVEG